MLTRTEPVWSPKAAQNTAFISKGGFEPLLLLKKRNSWTKTSFVPETNIE
jgi:hypothetical protein